MDIDLDCTRALDSGVPLTMVVLAGRPLIAVRGGGVRWVDPRQGPVELALALPVATASDGASLAGVHPAQPRAVRVIDGALDVGRDVQLSFAPSAVAIAAGSTLVVAASASGAVEVEGVGRWSVGSTRIPLRTTGVLRPVARRGLDTPFGRIDGLALAPDGARVAGCDSAGVFAARLDGSDVVRLVQRSGPAAGPPSAMAWSTAHGLWTFIDGVGLLRLDVDTGTSSELELEGQTSDTRAHAFSPDGTRLLVSDGEGAWIADTGRGRRLCSVRASDPGARLVCAALDADDTVGWALFEHEGRRRLARFDQA